MNEWMGEEAASVLRLIVMVIIIKGRGQQKDGNNSTSREKDTESQSADIYLRSGLWHLSGRYFAYRRRQTELMETNKN